MSGVDEVMVSFPLGGCPLLSRDAGCCDGFLGDFEQDGCFGDILDIDVPWRAFAIGATEHHITARINEEILPLVVSEAVRHFVEDISLGNTGKIHSGFKSEHFPPYFEVVFERSGSRREELFEYGRTWWHMGEIFFVANLLKYGQDARIEQTVTLLVKCERVQCEREHVGRGISKPSDMFVELREFAFGVESVENPHLFKTALDGFLNGLFGSLRFVFPVNDFDVGFRSHGPKETSRCQEFLFRVVVFRRHECFGRNTYGEDST